MTRFYKLDLDLKWVQVFITNICSNWQCSVLCGEASTNLVILVITSSWPILRTSVILLICGFDVAYFYHLGHQESWKYVNYNGNKLLPCRQNQCFLDLNKDLLRLSLYHILSSFNHWVWDVYQNNHNMLIPSALLPAVRQLQIYRFDLAYMCLL